jgi:hypothetical protein
MSQKAYTGNIATGGQIHYGDIIYHLHGSGYATAVERPNEILAKNNLGNLVPYGFEFMEVSESSRTAKTTLERVFKDLNTLCRLFHDYHQLLSTEEANAVKDTINDAREVIMKMGNSYKNEDKQRTAMLYKLIIWIVKDGNSVKLHLAELVACQNSINTWVTRLDGRIRQQNSGTPYILVTDGAPTDKIWQGGKTVAGKQVPDGLHSHAIRKELLEARGLESTSKRKRRRRRSHSPADGDKTELEEAGSRKKRQQRTSLNVPFAQYELGASDDSLQKEYLAYSKEDDQRRGRKRPEQRPTLSGILEEYKARTREDEQRRALE